MRNAAVDRGRRIALCSRAAVMCAGSKISVARSAEIVDLYASNPESGRDRCFKDMDGYLQNRRVGILATCGSVVSVVMKMPATMVLGHSLH